MPAHVQNQLLLLFQRPGPSLRFVSPRAEERPVTSRVAKPAQAVNPCKQPLWLAGLLCIAIGSALDVISFAFAPLSLLAPLGAMVRLGLWALGFGLGVLNFFVF